MDGESVDVYLADLRRLMHLIGNIDEDMLCCAFICGFPLDVSSQLKASLQINNSKLSEIAVQARVLISNRSSSVCMVSANGQKAIQDKDIRCRNCGKAYTLPNCPTV